MICPKCETEYVNGISVCADCGEELIPVEEFEGNLVHPKDWVIIYTCEDPIEADMLKSNLDGAEIESIIFTKRDRNFPVSGMLANVQLLVKKTQADEAMQIINDINNTKTDDEE